VKNEFLLPVLLICYYRLSWSDLSTTCTAGSRTKRQLPWRVRI
jgi:hypothetical protein